MSTGFEMTGRWEDLVSRPEFRGHQVRVTIIDPPPRVQGGPEWLEWLDRLAKNGVRIQQPADDSREAIYGDDE